MEEEDCGRVQDAYRSQIGAFVIQPAYLLVQVHVAAPRPVHSRIETDIIKFNTLEAVKDVFTSSLSDEQSLTSMKKMMRTPSFASSIVASAGLLSSSTLPTGARPVRSSPAASPLEDSMMEGFNHDDGALEDTMTTFDSQDLANSSTDAQLKGYSKDTKRAHRVSISDHSYSTLEVSPVQATVYDPDDQNIIAARVKIMDNIKGYKNKMLKQLETHVKYLMEARSIAEKKQY